eukprot:TRINITY_DN14205_c0_g1_i2.p1 TRINITY_DN14205_c0_g1~~TRINITY_DN14205_c0_g1_i2.p1  ORF type:complete len:160 (+),score=26.13 TRINITY_DN14205_c0_g1_i2:226-705(+)
MPLAQIIASRLSNPASSVKFMENNPVVIVSLGDPLRKHEFTTRRPVFRHIPKPLLISKFQFDSFPLQVGSGECGVPCVSLLRRPGLRKGDDSDQVVAKRLLMEAKTLMEQYYKDLSLIHISEPTRLLSISYAVFCLKKKKKILRKIRRKPTNNRLENIT